MRSRDRRRETRAEAAEETLFKLIGDSGSFPRLECRRTLDRARRLGLDEMFYDFGADAG